MNPWTPSNISAPHTQRELDAIPARTKKTQKDKWVREIDGTPIPNDLMVRKLRYPQKTNGVKQMNKLQAVSVLGFTGLLAGSVLWGAVKHGNPIALAAVLAIVVVGVFAWVRR